MKTILPAAAALLLLSTASYAQTATEPATSASPAQSTMRSDQSASNATIKPGEIRERVKHDLTTAGFTDVSVMPDSFLVQAKDKAGQPVTMIINPDSVTEVVADASSSSPAGQTGQGGTFTAVPTTDRLTSKVVGMSVYNDQNQDIGTVKDIAYNHAHVQAYILGVGGFLGMGDHYVAVAPSALKISYDQTAKDWRAVMNATKDQLKAAPEYKYPSAT